MSTTPPPEASPPAPDLLCDPPLEPQGRLSEEPRYRALRAEIDRAQEMTGSATDWAKVEELGRALLREGYDDLLVAAYTARAAQERAPLDGVHLGLTLFIELLGARWTSASPPLRRLRARVSALRWWVRSSTEALRSATTGERQGGLRQPAELDDLEAVLAKLGELTVTRMGDSAPALGALRRELRRLRPPPPSTQPSPTTDSGLAEVEPTSRQEPEQAEQTGQARPSLLHSPSTQSRDETSSRSASSTETDTSRASPAEPPRATRDDRGGATPDLAQSARPPTSTDDGDLERQIRRLGDQLIATSERLRSDSLRDPRAYDLLRHGLWLHLKSLPPVVDGKTTIADMSASARRQLAALRAGERWDEALGLAERLAVRHRLDLDLQRTTAESLLQLDPPAEQAAAAVRARTREFVARFPGVLDLRSREGTPLADSDTRTWLQDPPPALSSSRGRGAVQGAPTTPGRAYAAAGELITGPQTPEIDPAHPGDEPRFVERLSLAEEALEGGHRGLAYALFSGLEATVEHHRLDRWRPDLARRVFAGSLRAGTAPLDPASPQARRLGVLSPRTLAELLAPAG